MCRVIHVESNLTLLCQRAKNSYFYISFIYLYILYLHILVVTHSCKCNNILHLLLVYRILIYLFIYINNLIYLFLIYIYVCIYLKNFISLFVMEYIILYLYFATINILCGIKFKMQVYKICNNKNKAMK